MLHFPGTAPRALRAVGRACRLARTSGRWLGRAIAGLGALLVLVLGTRERLALAQQPDASAPSTNGPDGGAPTPDGGAAAPGNDGGPPAAVDVGAPPKAGDAPRSGIVDTDAGAP